MCQGRCSLERRKSIIFFFGLVFIILLKGIGATTTVNGIQSGYWSVGNSPFMVTDDIIIPEGLTLTIEPGVTIKFTGPYRFIVAGGLIARGTTVKRIIFTSNQDEAFADQNTSANQSHHLSEWYGIDFMDSSDDYLSAIDYCTIRYCKYGIRCRNAYPLLTHIIFANITNKSLILNNTDMAIQAEFDTDYLTLEQRPEVIPIPEPPPEKVEELIRRQKLAALQKAREDSIRIINKIKPSNTKCNCLVLDANDIMQLGFDTFPAILSFLPGFLNMPSYWEGAMPTCRAIFPGQFNNRILLLLNEIPVYEAITNSSFFEFIPLNTIDKIEVYRGPDGVQWGKNAFAGVVNIITKDPAQQFQMMTSSEVGSYYTKKISSYIGLDFGAADFSIGSSYRDDNGYYRLVNADEQGKRFQLKHEYDNYNFLIASNFDNLNMMAGYFKQSQYQFGVIPVHQYGGLADREGFLISAKYFKELSQNLSSELMTRFTYSSAENDVGALGNINPPNFAISKGNIFQSEIKINYHATSFGISIERDDADQILTLSDERDGEMIGYGSKDLSPAINEFSAFILSKYNFSPFIGCIGGLRGSYLGEGSDYFVSPSIKFIYNPFAPYHIQLSYQHGYRSPSLWERQILIKDILYSPSELMPEQIRSGEISFDYFNASFGKLNICSYWEEVSNLILHRELTPTEQLKLQTASAYILDNSNVKYQIIGSELNFQGELFTNFSILLSGAYQNFRFNVTNSYWPKIIGALRLSYRYNPKVLGSISFQYLGKQTAPQIEQHLNAYYIVNTTLNINILPQVKLEFIGHNLFNTKCFFAEFNRRIISSIPGGYPRAFFFLIKTELGH